MVCCRLHLSSGTLFALLADGTIHVWEVATGKDPVLLEVWDHPTPNNRDRVSSCCFMSGEDLSPRLADFQGERLAGGRDKAFLGKAKGWAWAPGCPTACLLRLEKSPRSWLCHATQVFSVTLSQSATAESPCLPAGLTLHSSGICENHLVVGTQTGDCLFLDISRGGLAVSSFPAHRQGRVCSDASHAWHFEEAGPPPVLSPWPPHKMSVLFRSLLPKKSASRHSRACHLVSYLVQQWLTRP